MVSALILLSRVLGLGRELVFAALLGAGLHADAFQIAFRIPNLLRDLFAEGALSAAFVPTYARVLVQDGMPAAHRLACRLLTLLGVVLGVIVLLGILGAPWVVAALAPGFADVEGKAEVTTLLARVMMPFLATVSFAAVAMGMLNARERFGPPALAPAMFNVVTVAWGGLLWWLGYGPFQVALGWAIGTLLGGLAQLLIQVPPLRSEGWRFQPEWAPGDPGIRAIAHLMMPAVLGLAAVQVNILVGSIFASQEPGAVSWLQYAFRILYLPIGVFGVAVGTIAGVGFARRAAAHDQEGMRDMLRRSLRVLAFLTLPASAGLMALCEPVVRLLYERGKFGPADTEATARALLFYAAGLMAYTTVKVLAPAFYALGTPRVPLFAGAVAVGLNILLMATLYDRLGYAVVALGTALGAFANMGILAGVLEQRLGLFRGSGLPRALAKMLLAAALMVPVAVYCESLMMAHVGAVGLWAKLATGLVPVVAGIAAYLVFAWLLRVGELELVLRALRRRAP
jgi:putative peptidoglycan lipid II flippase